MPNEVLTPPPTEPPAPPAPPPASAATFPENWRQTYVASRGNDPKLLSRLERYSDPMAAIDALISVQQKIGAGELRSNQPFPDKGTPEEQAAWRTANGIPDAPDKYDLKLKPGTVLGEEDKPVVDAFLKHAHERNLPASAVAASMEWYLANKERVDAAQAQRDEQLREQIDEQLRTEWGADYRKNKALVQAFLDTGPQGTRDALLNARKPDGTPLVSDINVVRWLVDKARDYNPPISVVPGDNATQVQAMEREIADLVRASAAPRHTPEFARYWKEGGDKRLRELNQAMERAKRV